VIDIVLLHQMVRSVTKDLSIAKARADGLTVEQIAQQLEWSMSTVLRSLKRSGRWYRHSGTATPADLLVNPPFKTGKDYEPACGTGAFLVHAAKAASKEAK
jgi:hypothetical protein